MPRKKTAPRKRSQPQARARSKLDIRIQDAAAIPSNEHVAGFKRPSFARFEAFALEDNSQAEIDIYDVIGGWELNAAGFRALLKTITAPRIVVNINSPGGSVFDAFAMYDDLKRHSAHVHVRVTGLAASAASLLAMAGDTIEIADNGFIMIHNAWNLAIGDKHEMTASARLLAQIDKRLAKTYAARTGEDADDVAEMMDAETWLDSEDAVARGFADTIGAPVDAKNLAHDVSCFAKTPAVVLKAARTNAAAETPKTPEAPKAVEDERGIVECINALAETLRNTAKCKPKPVPTAK